MFMWRIRKLIRRLIAWILMEGEDLEVTTPVLNGKDPITTLPADVKE